jgi:hypothetical protein
MACAERANPEAEMRRLWRLVFLLQILVPAIAAAAEQSIFVELNAAEAAENRCRLTFLIHNRRDSGLDTLKLDMALFDRDGIIYRRMATELGPVRAGKTNVRAFLLDGNCEQIGSVLVNDVTACGPGDAGACIDAVELASRVKGVRFYK